VLFGHARQPLDHFLGGGDVVRIVCLALRALVEHDLRLLTRGSFKRLLTLFLRLVTTRVAMPSVELPNRLSERFRLVVTGPKYPQDRPGRRFLRIALAAGAARL
jgi:hypothetical protein